MRGPDGSRLFPASRRGLHHLLLLAALAGPGAASVAADSAADGAVAIPFAHRVGDEWVLRFEREEERDGVSAPVVTTEVRVRVVSPYRGELLVEMRWSDLETEGRRYALEPRTAKNASLLDGIGGGLLLARVARDGTAREVLNWDDVQRALDRHAAEVRSSADDVYARPAVEPLLLRDWNTAYACCGLTMVPGRSVETRVEVPDALGALHLPAKDTRTLKVSRRRDGAVATLEVTSHLSLVAGKGLPSKEAGRAQPQVQPALTGEAALPAQLRVTQSGVTSYDAETGLLQGSSRREVATADRRTATTLRFRELRPAASVPATASR